MTLIDPLFNTDNPALLGDRAEEIDDLNQTPLQNNTGLDPDLTVSYSIPAGGDREVLYHERTDYIALLSGVESIIEIRALADDSETDLLTGEPIVLNVNADYAISGLTEANGDPLLDNDSISYSVESGDSDSHQSNIDLTESRPEPNLHNLNESNRNDDNLEIETDAESEDEEIYSDLNQNGGGYSDLLGNYISSGEIDSSDFPDSGRLEKSDSEIELILNRAIENIKTAVADKNLHDRRLALIPIAKELNSLLLDSPPTSDRESISFQKPEDFAQNIGIGASALAEAEFNREIQSPHIIGPPLAYSEETFVPRTGISSQIEQTTLDRRRRPLLLYGQRRMGKTSLLNNLGRLLPDNIIPLFVDLQGPASLASNNTGFLYNIARGMVKSAQTQSDLTLPQLTRQTLAADPFTVFDEWLDRVEETMGEKTALLALDEFEALEGAIAKKRFDPEEVLGMLRNLIQHRPRFKVLLAGSHAIEEFQPWASYLINVQVVKIGYLKESEARQLVERPVKDFALQYEPDAVERILYLTRCHPFLVQLLCEEIVAFKNEQNPASRPLATVADVEAAVPAALSSGSFFFADIKTNQISCLGSEVLQFMAARGEGAIINRSALSHQFSCNLDSTLDNLLRRELIEETDNGGYRFQVESIRRSFV